MGQKYVAYDAQGKIAAFYDSIDSPVPASIVNIIEITDEQWQTCLTTPGYTIVGGNLVAPTPLTEALLLEQAQTAQVAVISVACLSAITAGFASSALGAPYLYPAKSTDQQNLASSVLASLMPGLNSAWVTPFWCADASGAWQFRNHTAVQIQQVGQDGKAAILAAMEKNQTLAMQVQEATTVAAVQAVVWQ